MKYLICILNVFAIYFTSYYLFSFLVPYIEKFRRKENHSNKSNRILVIIPAHNEEKVISNILGDLKKQKYKNFDSLVIADNCNDNTEWIALDNGASNVFRRKNDKLRGKQYAVNDVMKSNVWKAYDAVTIIDADNRIPDTYLYQMNLELNKGYEVVQSYITVTKEKGWISAVYEVMYKLNNHMFFGARRQLRLSTMLGGTGFIISKRLIELIDWNFKTVTEDFEMTFELIKKGFKIGFTYDTYCENESPKDLKAVYKQRLRWQRGYYQVAVKNFKDILKLFIKTGKFQYFDSLMLILNPFATIVFILLLITQILNINYLIVWLIYQTLYYGLYIIADWKISIFKIRYLPHVIFINNMILAIIIHGLFTYKNNYWFATKHTG